MESQHNTHKDGQSDWLIWLKWVLWGQWRAQDSYVAGLAIRVPCQHRP